jgi:NAD-dependent SIR2 family protein deacetylase
VQTQLVAANPALADLPASSAAKPLPDGDAQIEPEALDRFRLPSCCACSGTLMPDVVFFGDNLPQARRDRALALMDAADALLVVGSSLMVYSGFRFCRLAAAAGKPIAALNLGRTRADALLSLKTEASAERLLPEVASLLQTQATPF